MIFSKEAPAIPRGGRRSKGEAAFSDTFPGQASTRILVFADAYGASQSLAFVEGLADARRKGRIAVRIVEEAAFPGDSCALDGLDIASLVEVHFQQTEPDVVVLSRMGHEAIWREVQRSAARMGVPILFHIDDDILDLPASLGIERYRLAKNPKRLRTLWEILAAADMVLASTPALAAHLQQRAGHDRFHALEAGSAGRPHPRSLAQTRKDVVIGYMGSASHDHDLALAVPALNRIAGDYSHVRLVVFGSISEQPVVRTLLAPVTRHPAVKGEYVTFQRRLAELRFDIGLAPLVDDAFNRMKTPTKWIEYAEAGAAVIASPVAPYRPLIAAGAALGASNYGWEAALRRLIEDVDLRAKVVARADALLEERFGWDRLAMQIEEAIVAVQSQRGKAA